MHHIAIVGAGQAGAALAAKLRALGHDGPISVFGEEPFAPYQRPPLSKRYLTGEADRDAVLLRPATFWREAEIALRTRTRVLALEAEGRRLVLDTGERIACDQIALTTGSRPILLPAAMGGRLAGVHALRTLADADAMVPAVVPGVRVLIVGGGYIGLEMAAVAASRGLRVVLVEQAPRILARVACVQTADWFRDLHGARGVDVREGVALVRLEGDATGRVTAAHLSDGTSLPVDFAVVGIGARPAIDLAADAGLAIDDGIAVDEVGRTSAKGIFAAGDCTSFPWRGRRIRLESVPHAIAQAEAVAATMLGRETAYVATPWFWSDQFDVKLQIAGLGTGHDRVIVRRGERPGAVSHWTFHGDTLLSVEAMNDARAYMTGKRLIEAAASPPIARVADPSVPLVDLMPVRGATRVRTTV